MNIHIDTDGHTDKVICKGRFTHKKNGELSRVELIDSSVYKVVMLRVEGRGGGVIVREKKIGKIIRPEQFSHSLLICLFIAAFSSKLSISRDGTHIQTN